MHQSETRALLRAALLLLLISVLRWGWSRARIEPSAQVGASVLPELLADSRAAVADADRRKEPLGEGERVDPNRGDEVELDRLPGVGPATARAIIEARERGTVFRAPDDLLAVRGIGPATLERMRPFLAFAGAPPPRRTRTDEVQVERIDVNRADAERLRSLPGVGPALAARIVAERQKQMFTSVDDLQRVRGIGPATVERLRAFVVVGRGR